MLRYIFGCIAALCLVLSSCGKADSYANLLEDQNKDVNRFLSDQRVETELPADGNWITGPDAPYYVLDEENGVYMQVLDPGDPNDMVHSDQEVFFHYLGASLKDYTSMDALTWSGNAQDMGLGNYSFRYENFTLPSSYQWGTGIQQPLRFLGLGCHVNLVVKSLAGFPALQSEVTPFLFNVSYHPSALTDTH